jgi:ubiquinone/menaquinone biosynthesis C-methylase UbiE
MTAGGMTGGEITGDGMTGNEMTDAVAAAYDAGAQGWSSGPEPLYARLAAAMLRAAAVPVRNARVLDVGAGTAVASRAALAAGASRVVAVDLAPGMLRRRGAGIAPVVADAARLPFLAGAFDLVLSACCLSHLPDPRRAVREARRVGAVLVASAFAPAWTHPAKAAVDDVLAGAGFVAPAWYLRLKRDGEPVVDDPARLAELARTAGYRDVTVRTAEVAAGLSTPAEIAAWRLGLAHVTPFIAALPAHRLAQTRRAAELAVAELMAAGTPPLVVPLLVLTAR